MEESKEQLIEKINNLEEQVKKSSNDLSLWINMCNAESSRVKSLKELLHLLVEKL